MSIVNRHHICSHSRSTGSCAAAWLLAFAGLSTGAAALADGPAAIIGQGYRLQELGGGLYLISDHDSQSLFMVYDRGVVVIDAPPSYSARIPQAIAEVTRNPVTHVVYLNSRADRIGGVKQIGGEPIIIAHEATARLLEVAADPDRPPPTVTFGKDYTLEIGDGRLELMHPDDPDSPEETLVFVTPPRVLIVAELAFSGWRPWRRLSPPLDAPERVVQLEAIRRVPWVKLVSSRPGEILDPDDAGTTCLAGPCRN